jgi:hypothetical protein
VDEVGPEVVECLANRPEGREGKIKLLIEREIDGSHKMDVLSLNRLAVIGMNQLDLVTTLAEVANELS